MKKLLLFCLCLQASNAAWAQDYQALQASGFNADVIANGVGPAANSTSIALDNADYNLLGADFTAVIGGPLPIAALPVSGLINDANIAGLSFQLAPYSQSNSLRLQDESDFGALTFSNTVLRLTYTYWQLRAAARRPWLAPFISQTTAPRILVRP